MPMQPLSAGAEIVGDHPLSPANYRNTVDPLWESLTGDMMAVVDQVEAGGISPDAGFAATAIIHQQQFLVPLQRLAATYVLGAVDWGVRTQRLAATRNLLVQRGPAHRSPRERRPRRVRRRPARASRAGPDDPEPEPLASARPARQGAA
jgi:hypothetical protein